MLGISKLHRLIQIKLRRLHGTCLNERHGLEIDVSEHGKYRCISTNSTEVAEVCKLLSLRSSTCRHG